MAYICEKPKGSCKSCSHFRFDEDYGANCCWAAYDNNTKKLTSVFDSVFDNSLPDGINIHNDTNDESDEDWDW